MIILAMIARTRVVGYFIHFRDETIYIVCFEQKRI
jgi:hypothetical protein